MKPFARLTLGGLAAGSGLALAACIVDLSGLADGISDAGSSSSSTSSWSSSSSSSWSSSSSSSSSSTSSTGSGGWGGGGSTSSATTSSSTGGSGPAGCAATVLDCSDCPCTDGSCDPVLLSNQLGAEDPQGIAISADGLFWTNKTGGQIMYASKDGGWPVVLADKMLAPTAIAATMGRIVFAAQDGIYTCLISDCAPSRIARSGSLGSIQSVAYDGGLVYWTDLGSDPNEHHGSLFSCSATACMDKPTTVSALEPVPFGLALTSSNVYWSAQGTGEPNGGVFGLARTTGAPGTKVPISQAKLLPSNLATDGTYVYWTQAKVNGKVLYCETTNPNCYAPNEVAPSNSSSGQFPGDIAYAGGRIYWGDNAGGKILSCSAPHCKAGEQPRVHVTGLANLRRFAVGSSCLFWTDASFEHGVSKIGL